MNLIWKDIIGFEGHYQINDIGQIYSLKSKKFLSTPINSSGYPVVSLWKNNKVKMFSLHRLMALHFIPNPENKPHINHKDSNRRNFYLNNLEWVSSKENVIHGVKFGHGVKGEKANKSKLTEKEVLKIRKDLTKGISCYKIAKKYKLYISTICRIRDRITWKHI